VGNIFKDLTSGFSSFVLAWLVPSGIVVALFSLFVYPPLIKGGTRGPTWSEPLTSFVATGAVAATAVLAMSIVVLALVTSLASRPLYRLLEGYSLPESAARPMRRRQRLRYRQLQVQAGRSHRGALHRRGLAREELGNYPAGAARLLPTRLGNALKALETYGSDRYRLDSQSFWYEIYGSAPERNCRDADQARASVDFFVSLIGLMGLLSAVSGIAAATTGSGQCVVVAAGALATTRPAYSAALRNMTDWRYAVQALVNLSRPELAKGLGYRLPDTLAEEQRFWSAWTGLVGERHEAALAGFDSCRRTYSDELEAGGAGGRTIGEDS